MQSNHHQNQNFVNPRMNMSITCMGNPENMNDPQVIVNSPGNLMDQPPFNLHLIHPSVGEPQQLPPPQSNIGLLAGMLSGNPAQIQPPPQSLGGNFNIQNDPIPQGIPVMNVVNQIQMLIRQQQQQQQQPLPPSQRQTMLNQRQQESKQPPDVLRRTSANTSPVDMKISSVSSSPLRGGRPPPPISLPPSWKTATDAEGRVYYYHTLTRKTSWDPPMDIEDDDIVEIPAPKKEKRRRSASSQHSPSRSSSSSHRIAAADTTHQVGPKTPPFEGRASNSALQKKRDLFKSKISAVVVNSLNPFQKNDCKQGRIRTQDDFKFLARKLTHGLLMKEIQRIKDEDKLDCNDSVRTKVKEYIRMYMKKFGAYYERS